MINKGDHNQQSWFNINLVHGHGIWEVCQQMVAHEWLGLLLPTCEMEEAVDVHKQGVVTNNLNQQEPTL